MVVLRWGKRGLFSKSLTVVVEIAAKVLRASV